MSTLSIPSGGGTSTQTPGFTGSFNDLVAPLTQGAFTAFQQPFPTFTPDQVIAPLNANQNGAFNMVSNIAANPNYGNAIIGAGTGTLNATATPSSFTNAVNGLSAPVGYQSIQAPTFNQAAATAYESPYTQDVVKQALASFDQNASLQDAQNRARLAGEGAFGAGGDESEALLAGQNALARGNLQANLLNTGYTNAQQQFNADTTRGLTAATSNQNAGLAASGLTGQNLARAGALVPTEQQTQLAGNQQYASLAKTLHDMGLTDASALLGVGNQQQQQDQAGKTFTYQQAIAQNQYPTQQANNLASILFGSPKSTNTTTTPGTSAAQAVGLGIAGLGALPGAVTGGTALAKLLGFTGGSSDTGTAVASGLGAGGSSIVPDLSVAPDTSLTNDLFNTDNLFASGGTVRGAFQSYRRGGRAKGAFAEGGDVSPDASMAEPDAPAAPSLSDLIGGGSMSESPSAPSSGSGLTGWVSQILDNPLVALGASIAGTPGSNPVQVLGQGIAGAQKLAPELKAMAAKTRLTDAQAQLAGVQGQQKNLLLNFARGGNGITATDGGLLIDPRRIKSAIDMFAMGGDGRSAGVYKSLLDMATKGNFDAKTGNYFVPNSVLQGVASTKLAGEGVVPGGNTMPAVTPVAGAPAALANFAGAKSGAEAAGSFPYSNALNLNRIVKESQVSPMPHYETDANGNLIETQVPRSTLAGGSGPAIGPGSAFNPAAPAPKQATPALAPVLPQAASASAPLVGPGSAMNPTPDESSDAPDMPTDNAAPKSIVPLAQDLAPGKWANPDLPTLPSAQAGKVTLNPTDQEDRQKAPEVVQKFGQQGTEAATAVTMAKRALDLTKTLKTGIGTDAVSDINRVLTYGGFPPLTGSVPPSDVQELNKIASQMMLATLKGMPGGRPLYSEGAAATKATVDPSLEFGANRAILSSAISEGSQRMGLAAAAPAYARDNGGRMRGFEQMYQSRHPYSSTYEQTHNAIMAMAPPGQRPTASAQPGISEGTTATNSQTGAKVVRRGGAWVPVGSGQPVLPAMGQ